MMFTIKEIANKIKEARDFAIKNNIGNLDVDLQLFADGTWKFHHHKKYYPDGTGYWASTWVEPEDDDKGCHEHAIALIANLNISNNDQLKQTIENLLKECDENSI